MFSWEIGKIEKEHRCEKIKQLDDQARVLSNGSMWIVTGNDPFEGAGNVIFCPYCGEKLPHHEIEKEQIEIEVKSQISDNVTKTLDVCYDLYVNYCNMNKSGDVNG